jgi:RNA polymerase sigma-70 factor (ECF subfamily)
LVDDALGDPRSDDAPHALGLAAIYRAEAARVSRWIERLDPGGDTEDLLHEVFLVVKKKLPEFRGEAALATWLHAITTRVVIAARRRRRVRRFLFGREQVALVEERAAPRTPEELFRGREVGALLYQLLDGLPERDRTLLILRELEGLGGQELGRVAGLSPDAVAVALHRARARLRKAYVARFGEPEEA